MQGPPPKNKTPPPPQNKSAKQRHGKPKIITNLGRTIPSHISSFVDHILFVVYLLRSTDFYCVPAVTPQSTYRWKKGIKFQASASITQNSAFEIALPSGSQIHTAVFVVLGFWASFCLASLAFPRMTRHTTPPPFNINPNKCRQNRKECIEP